MHHATLGHGDAITLRTSIVEQLEKNVSQIEKGPLDDAVVRELEKLSGPTIEASKACGLFRGQRQDRGGFGR